MYKRETRMPTRVAYFRFRKHGLPFEMHGCGPFCVAPCAAIETRGHSFVLQLCILLHRIILLINQV